MSDTRKTEVIGIASGKGGVGKSTASVNLACALKHLGASVGLLDCDIYGPSIPLMMGVHQQPEITDEEHLVPPFAHGVRLMSMGFLIPDDQPVIWRGPMIQKTITQFVHDVAWGELDFLLVDLPPGTGDVSLSLAQLLPAAHVLVVTTPQLTAQRVARRAPEHKPSLHDPINLKPSAPARSASPRRHERLEVACGGVGGGRFRSRRRGGYATGARLGLARPWRVGPTRLVGRRPTRASEADAHTAARNVPQKIRDRGMNKAPSMASTVTLAATPPPAAASSHADRPGT